jgi:hypothetical protein
MIHKNIKIISNFQFRIVRKAESRTAPYLLKLGENSRAAGAGETALRRGADNIAAIDWPYLLRELIFRSSNNAVS